MAFTFNTIKWVLEIHISLFLKCGGKATTNDLGKRNKLNSLFQVSRITLSLYVCKVNYLYRITNDWVERIKLNALFQISQASYILYVCKVNHLCRIKQLKNSCNQTFPTPVYNLIVSMLCCVSICSQCSLWYFFQLFRQLIGDKNDLKYYQNIKV